MDRLERENAYLMEQIQLKRQRSKAYHEKKSKDNRHHFIKYYKMKNRELVKSKMLSKAEKAFLYDILSYVNIETDLVTDERGIPMDAKRIMKVCDIGKTLFYSISSHLIEIGILIPVTEGDKVYYKLHEDYFDCH